MKLTEAIKSVKPRALPKGGTIGITAPSSQINVKNIDNFRKVVENAGFDVVLGETITNMYDRDFNSAKNETRARDFMALIEDDSVDVVWSGAGGFGAQTMTSQLDFDVIKAKAKPIIGFSDNTFFLNAITQKTDLITFLGPTAEITDVEKDKKSISYALSMLMGNVENYEIENFSGLIRKVSRTLDQSVGRFAGGNITMLQTSLGTEWEIETEGKILLLEEVGESSYSLERTLRHLEEAGKFDGLAGLIFGEFSNVKREPLDRSHDSNPSMNEIIAKMFHDAEYPVLMDYNFSHGDYNLTFPIGGLGKVNSRERTTEISEKPVK